MRIVRDESRWLILFPDGRAAQCLKGLAVRCGFRVGELSDALGHSERYVQEVFGRDLGVPPKIWLRKERMEVAARLLSEGLRPGEVGERLGFSHGSGFRREFRNRYGITPSEYARQAVAVAGKGRFAERSARQRTGPFPKTDGSASRPCP